MTGIHPEAMSTTVLSMAWDVPDAVVLRHRIDLERCVLERLVSDVTGIVEHESIDLEHACVPCAIRMDAVPTLQRLARDPRWGAVIAELPVSAEANQVCHVLTQDRDLRRFLRVSSVVAAVDGGLVEDDLLGDELLPERDIATSHEDRRGVGEVCADIVEFADVVVINGRPEPVGIALVEALARPGVLVVVGSEQLEAGVISAPLHEIGRTRAWANPARTAVLPALGSTRIWRVDLQSDRAFHPERLLDGLAQIGAGRHRSKGCFWLPTRPDRVQVWAGAGGQVSIGTGDAWGRLPRHTRIVLTGAGTAPAHLQSAFASMLLKPGEAFAPAGGEDGFEPWLGPIREVA